VKGKGKDMLKRSMTKQTLEATKESDLVLLIFDARVGITSDLTETARWLQKHIHRKRWPENDDDETAFSPKTVVLLANKLEGNLWSSDPHSYVLEHLAEASRIGFGEAIPISAEHGEGMGDVAVVIQNLTNQKRKSLQKHRHLTQKSHEKPLQLAILGRQNVGKSTLVNALLQKERVITGPTPGLTRDAISIPWLYRNTRPVQLVDTAGIRKISQRHQDDSIEDQSVNDAVRAMKVSANIFHFSFSYSLSLLTIAIPHSFHPFSQDGRRRGIGPRRHLSHARQTGTQHRQRRRQGGKESRCPRQ